MNTWRSIVPKLVDAGTPTVIKLFEGWISSAVIKRGDSHSEEKKPCTTCMIYQHVALALSYIEPLRSRLNSDGTVPAGLGGTIPEAQNHLRQAASEIPSIVGIHPSIDVACRQLTEIIPDLVVHMDHIKNDAEWDYVITGLRNAREIAYTIPETVYRRDTFVESPEPERIVRLTQSDAELLALVASVRKNEISEADAKAKLSQLLKPEVDVDGN